MNRILWPDWYFEDIAHIPDGFFMKNNIRFLLCDIDNTLAPYSADTPPASVLTFFERLKSEGVHPAFVSNNNMIRVSRSVRDLAYRALQARETLAAEMTREPTVEQIAARLGEPCEAVTRAMEAIVEPISLFESVYSDGEDSV